MNPFAEILKRALATDLWRVRVLALMAIGATPLDLTVRDHCGVVRRWRTWEPRYLLGG